MNSVPRTSNELTSEVSRLLEAGNFFEAFKNVDRLCRTAQPDARILLLRSKILRELAGDAASDRDLKDAFQLDPTDAGIAFDILGSSLSELHPRATQALISSPRAGFKGTRFAVEKTFTADVDLVADLRAEGHLLTGWVAWKGSELLEATFEENEHPEKFVSVSGDRNHPLAGSFCNVAAIRATLTQRGPKVRFFVDGKEILRSFINIRTVEVRSQFNTRRTDLGIVTDAWPCNVVVPIYDDLEMTALCLEALANQRPAHEPTRIVLVNDNPGHIAMRDLTRAAASKHGFELIENDKNLGFIGSVNKALATVEYGDVLLLNADAVLPTGAIVRLRKAAYSQADIGTVSPLTNNGELTNLPRPFQPNRMGSLADIEATDSIAEQVNRGRVVDIPCGIGFCLYIRADCFAAVGELATAYLRGYMEDVEFCLRAREAGFRNVCAADVYVGHMGTRSFKDEKRALVVHNFRVLEARFSDISDDTLAFIEADPLRALRANIEQRAVVEAPRRRLVIVRAREDAVVQKRIASLQAKRYSVLTLSALPFESPFHMTLRLEDEGMPQSSVFDVTQLRDNSALIGILRRLNVREVEIFSDCVIPNAFAKILAVGDFRVRTVLDACPLAVLVGPKPSVCETLSTSQACLECRATLVPSRTRLLEDPFGLTALASRKRLRPRALNRMAEALFRRLNIQALSTDLLSAQIEPSRPVDFVQTQTALNLDSLRPPDPKQPQLKSHRRARIDRQNDAMAILLPAPSAAVEPLLRLLAGSPARLRAGRPLVIFGRSLDDDSLLSFPEVAITGPVAAEEYDELFLQYNIEIFFAPERWGGFYLVDELATRTGLPHAYFDWSFGRMARNPGALGLDPRICNTKAARIVIEWALDHERSFE